MESIVKIADWNNIEDRTNLKSIRQRVFIEEQKVPAEMEWDEFDNDAIHCLAYIDSRAVGAGRLISSGQIGRMAVLPEYRHQGIGEKVLQVLISAHKENNTGKLFIHAQTHAINFYNRAGFIVKGNEFDEAGIPHYEMILKV